MGKVGKRSERGKRGVRRGVENETASLREYERNITEVNEESTEGEEIKMEQVKKLKQ